MIRLERLWSSWRGPRIDGRGAHERVPLACVIGDVSMVRALGRAGIPVALVTDDEAPNAAYSRFCSRVVRTPSFVDSPQEAVGALLEFARAEPTPPVVFYQGDHDLLALSRARDSLVGAVRLVLPPAELVECFVDKLRFAELAERRALPVPPTRILERGRGLSNALREWSHFPCVLKPAIRTRWVGSSIARTSSGTSPKAVRIEDRASLDLLLPLLEAHETDFVVQAAIEGGEERIHSYHAYVRSDGTVVGEFTGRKIRTYPRRYGYSTYVEITDDPEVRALGRSIVATLGFHGVLKIDFKRDPRDETLSMLEINPRFSLWLHPGALAGVGLAELVYRDCLEPGAARLAPRARPGVRWMIPREDLRGVRETSGRGAADRWVRWLLDAVRADINEDFTFVDPLPGLVTLGEVVGRRLGPSGGSVTRTPSVAGVP